MKKTSYIPEWVDIQSEVLFVGISPSANTKPNNATFVRLRKWASASGLESFDFWNVIPSVVKSQNLKDVDHDALKSKCIDKKIVALGGFVSRVLNSHGIKHLKIDHPSPLNRNLNNPEYEMQLIETLKGFVHD